MIKPICEKGIKCVFSEKRIETYLFPLHARSQIILKGKELVYYCTNPRKLRSYEMEKRLTHKEKFAECGFKTTNRLEDFNNVK